MHNYSLSARLACIYSGLFSHFLLKGGKQHNWEDVADNISDVDSNFKRETFEQLFEIDDIAEYLEVIEVEDEEEDNEEEEAEEEVDDMTVIRNIDVKVQMPMSWVFYYLMAVNAAVFGMSAYQVWTTYQNQSSQ